MKLYKRIKTSFKQTKEINKEDKVNRSIKTQIAQINTQCDSSNEIQCWIDEENSNMMNVNINDIKLNKFNYIS